MNKQRLSSLDRKNILAVFDYLHQTPEISCQEYETARYIKNYLVPLGFVIEEVVGTGFTAYLKNGEGPVLGLRAELDGLPVVEKPSTLSVKRQVISMHQGVMHACGHDAHMTIVLYTLQYLAQHLDQWHGTVIGIFEEGEEVGAGITEMVDHCQKFDFDYIYGNHVFNDLPTGTISVTAGPVMAGCGVFDLTLKGRGGHGSRPDRCINPIGVATEIYTALHQSWPTAFDIEQIVTLAITRLTAGNTMNVIPDLCRMSGTVRFFEADVGGKAMDLIRSTVDSVAKLRHCQVSYDLLVSDQRAVINDEWLANLLQEAIMYQLPDVTIVDNKWYASETFAQYQLLCPTLFTLIGLKNEKLGTGAEHHNEYFAVDPEAVFIGIEVMILLALRLLN